MSPKAKLLALISVLAVAILFTGPASSEAVPIDIALNGGFETGDFTDWVLFPSFPGNISIFSPGSGSTFAAFLDNQISGTASVLKNANLGVGVVTPGQAITITFDARGAGEIGGVVFAELFSEIDGGGVSASLILGGAPLALNADPNVWTNFSFTTNAGPDVSGGITVQFAAVTGANIGSISQVYVDNLTVTVDSPVPVEATSWTGIKRSSR